MTTTGRDASQYTMVPLLRSSRPDADDLEDTLGEEEDEDWEDEEWDEFEGDEDDEIEDWEDDEFEGDEEE